MKLQYTTPPTRIQITPRQATATYPGRSRHDCRPGNTNVVAVRFCFSLKSVVFRVCFWCARKNGFWPQKRWGQQAPSRSLGQSAVTASWGAQKKPKARGLAGVLFSVDPPPPPFQWKIRASYSTCSATRLARRPPTPLRTPSVHRKPRKSTQT